MEENEYLLVNNEKTIFMKWEEQEFILIGVFVDDISAIPTTQKLKIEFETLHTKEFDLTGETPMESFLGLEVEQDNDGISLYLDTYVQELIDEYWLMHRKFIKPKPVPISMEVVLDS